MNTCDYGHQTSKEIRRFPVGNVAGVLVCEIHYLEQMEFRKDRNKHLDKEAQFELPGWEELTVDQVTVE